MRGLAGVHHPTCLNDITRNIIKRVSAHVTPCTNKPNERFGLHNNSLLFEAKDRRSIDFCMPKAFSLVTSRTTYKLNLSIIASTNSFTSQACQPVSTSVRWCNTEFSMHPSIRPRRSFNFLFNHLPRYVFSLSLKQKLFEQWRCRHNKDLF